MTVHDGSDCCPLSCNCCKIAPHAMKLVNRLKRLTQSFYSGSAGEIERLAFATAVLVGLGLPPRIFEAGQPSATALSRPHKSASFAPRSAKDGRPSLLARINHIARKSPETPWPARARAYTNSPCLRKQKDAWLHLLCCACARSVCGNHFRKARTRMHTNN